MEDCTLKEINKIGDLIRALFEKIGVMKASEKTAEAFTATKIELAENLNIDIDTLLAQDDFVGVLVRNHDFSLANLESFAELLADLAAAAEQPHEQVHLAAAACEIYKHQEAHKAPASFNRHYILRELENYNNQ